MIFVIVLYVIVFFIVQFFYLGTFSLYLLTATSAKNNTMATIANGHLQLVESIFILFDFALTNSIIPLVSSGAKTLPPVFSTRAVNSGLMPRFANSSL